MFHGRIKASEKLPRGTYFYLTVGDRFYAGEEAVVAESAVVLPTDHYSDWRTGTPGRWWRGGRVEKIDPRYVEWYRKRTGRAPPPYYIQQPEEPRPTKKTVTGSKARLTDEFKEVKQFRRLNQAEAACERLKKLYADFDIRVSIELHEGDK